MQEEGSKKCLPESSLKANTSMGHYNYDKTVRDVHKQRINRLLSSDTIDKPEKLKQLKLEVEKLS